ncbi:DUF397 domain-containing protein [Streptosporangium sp. NPDC000239]|uniref:DUF397 domain-containing protein n=1 Tax=Streptosporangium sp. NPDC000239 TaxID=3154248 RepID=UPI003318E30D
MWRKSSLSSGNGGQCVEVAVNLPEMVIVRDSKDSDGPKLFFAPHAWRSFVGEVKTGEFDR